MACGACGCLTVRTCRILKCTAPSHTTLRFTALYCTAGTTSSRCYSAAGTRTAARRQALVWWAASAAQLADATGVLPVCSTNTTNQSSSNTVQAPACGRCCTAYGLTMTVREIPFANLIVKLCRPQRACSAARLACQGAADAAGRRRGGPHSRLDLSRHGAPRRDGCQVGRRALGPAGA